MHVHVLQSIYHLSGQALHPKHPSRHGETAVSPAVSHVAMQAVCALQLPVPFKA